jgi:hypothetical protein
VSAYSFVTHRFIPAELDRVQDWNVETTSLAMNLLAPVLMPLFAWNHRWVMRRGEEGGSTRRSSRPGRPGFGS